MTWRWPMCSSGSMSFSHSARKKGSQAHPCLNSRDNTMPRTLLYIANVRLPTDNAHGVQIMKTCEALAECGVAVTLIHPWRINKHKGDPFAVYRVKRNFRL